MGIVTYRRLAKGGGATWQARDGWFLFGFIPIYVRDLCMKGGQ